MRSNIASVRPAPVPLKRTRAGRFVHQVPPLGNKFIAIVVLVVIALRIDIDRGVTVGAVVCIALFPVWFPILRQYWGARLLLIGGLVAIGSGIWLTVLSAPTHEASLGQAFGSIAGLVGLIAGVGFVLWARTVLPDSQIAIWYGAGILLGVSPSSELYAANPWRFGYSVALTILLLGITLQLRRRWLELAVALALTVVATLTDARSAFAFMLLTVLLVAWQMRPTRPTRGKSALRALLGLGVLGLIVFNVIQSLILDGALGAATQQRTLAQLNETGSLILGGRPELAATIALMQHQPWGFGVGAVPNPEDILAAKTGMAAINYEPNNGYVDNYMFGGHIELHSVIGDFWAAFGLPGLMLTLIILVLIVRSIGVHVAANTASAVLLYLGIKAVWFMFFGPFFSSSVLLVLVLGLLITRRVPTERDAALQRPGPLRLTMARRRR
ncbi:O-antigen ligase family protein [Cryobacterium sp. Y57]|uniref:O-antigen ligase family protein n=1 Tax=Cryobacterium sp. Y57 TaxID=2048287 RepID=UPI000CE46422|nr:O-antigen ligase family protein [Cryobacterium sp. Y57]